MKQRKGCLFIWTPFVYV